MRASLRAAGIDIVSFQPLPELPEFGFRRQRLGLWFALLKSEKEDAMKTKTNVKAGYVIHTVSR
jgi:hypothetical protein